MMTGGTSNPYFRKTPRGHTDCGRTEPLEGDQHSRQGCQNNGRSGGNRWISLIQDPQMNLFGKFKCLCKFDGSLFVLGDLTSITHVHALGSSSNVFGATGLPGLPG